MAKKALMVWGGWSGHEPKQCVDIFAPLLEDAGFEVTVSDTLDSYKDADMMGELSLVVPVWTMGQIEREQEQGLQQEQGKTTGAGKGSDKRFSKHDQTTRSRGR